MSGDKKNGNDNWEIFKALSMFSQLGVSMAVCIALGVLAGKLLDWLFGTGPILLIIFSLFGGIASFVVMYDLVIKRWMK